MKKTIFKYIVLAALACVGVSCQKGLEEVQEGGLTVTATIAGGGASSSSDGTKVLAEDTGTALKLKWEVGDIVFGFDDADKTYNFKVTAVAGGKATLKRIAAGSEKGTATSDPADGTKMYLFYAPGMKASDLNLSDPTASLFTYDISTQAKDVVPVLMTSTGIVQNGALALDFQVRTALIGIKTPTMAVASQAYTAITLSALAGTVNTLNTKVTFSKDGDDIAASYDTPGEINKTVEFTTSDPVAPISDIIYIAACPVGTASTISFHSENGTEYGEDFVIAEAKTMNEGRYYYFSPTFAEPQERTITVSFAGEVTNDTFGTENTIRFPDGEKIKISNGKSEEECTITGSKFTTHLIGTLTAVYPSTAATGTGSSFQIDPACGLPSASQDGTLAGALVAKATIGADVITGAVSFENQNETVVYKVVIPENATGFKVRSLPTIPTSGSSVGLRSGAAAKITSSDGTEITVSPGSGETLTGPCYVCLKAGVKLSDLAFDASFKEEISTNVSGTMKGIPERSILDLSSKNTTVAKTAYTIDASNWHEYIEIDGEKWSKANLGAEKESDPGLYFMWGEITGHRASSTGTNAFQTDFDNFNFSADPTRYTGNSIDETLGFAVKNAPYCKNDGTGTIASTYWYTKYTSSSNHYSGQDDKTVLELSDDAAYVNWGGPWRIPSMEASGEKHFTKLGVTNTTKVVERSITTIDSQKGVLLTRVAGPALKLFFPLAGYGDGLDLITYDGTYDYARYWTVTNRGSTGNSTYYQQTFTAYFKIFGTSTSSSSSLYFQQQSGTNTFSRSYGHTIRPVAD